MNEITIETEILQKTEALNLEIFALFCKLDRFKDKLTEPAYKYMADKLFTLYREEFDRIFSPYELERAQEKYIHKKRRAKFAPRESWFFGIKNRAAKHFFAIIKEEAEKFFSLEIGTAESGSSAIEDPQIPENGERNVND